MDACSFMGGLLPNITIDAKVSFNGVSIAKFGDKEASCVTRALAELLGEPEDDIEDLKGRDRPFDADKRQPPGLDITFSLRKRLKRGMKFGTNLEKIESVRALWKPRDKVDESIDPKPTELLDRLDFIVKGGGGKRGLLHSLQVRKRALLLTPPLLLLGSSYMLPPCLTHGPMTLSSFVRSLRRGGFKA